MKALLHGLLQGFVFFLLAVTVNATVISVFPTSLCRSGYADISSVFVILYAVTFVGKWQWKQFGGIAFAIFFCVMIFVVSGLYPYHDLPGIDYPGATLLVISVQSLVILCPVVVHRVVRLVVDAYRHKRRSEA